MVTIQGNQLFISSIENAVYALSQELGIGFWRAKHTKNDLAIQIDSEFPNGSQAEAAVKAEVLEKTGIRATVRVVPTKDLISFPLLKQRASFQKPKFVFSENEDWEKAIHY